MTPFRAHTQGKEGSVRGERVRFQRTGRGPMEIHVAAA